jgi:hypothetical protein
MKPLLEGIIEGINDGTFNSVLQSYCQHWREHPTQYALGFAIRHAIESDHPQLVYEPLADPDFRKLRAAEFGMNALRADIRSAIDYFSTKKQNLLRYYQLLFLGQQIPLFIRHHSSSKYQNYCRAYLQFLQLNEPPTQRKDIGISRVLNRRFPMEFDDQKQGRRHRIELESYEIGDWRCRCGARQGHVQRYALECKACKENGVIDEDEKRCLRCGGPGTYVTCTECNTRVTLDILWRIENGDLHPRELIVPLKATLKRCVDGSSPDILSLTLLQFPLMFGISEKGGTFHFDSPGLLWIDTSEEQSSIYVFDGDVKYDRQTNPLKIFEALLSRTFSPYNPNPGHIQRHSLKSRLQQGYIYHDNYKYSFTQGFRRRMTKLAQAMPAISTDFSFDCLVSATKSLTHNMAILNRDSILSKNLVASFIDHKIVSLDQKDILTSHPLGKVISTSLDDDGIVIIGTLVHPGDVLVGIGRPREQPTAEEKLLTAIFGEEAVLMEDRLEDRSIRYDGKTRARVIDIERKVLWHVRTLISITLAVELPIGMGDTLHAQDGSKAVICRMAQGPELKNLTGCTEEPDLLISTNHPWATALSETSSKCFSLPVFIKSETLIGQNIHMRGHGPYSIRTSQPISDDSDYHIPQVMTKDDFSWLLNYHLTNTLFELMQTRSDCFDGRVRMYKLALTRGYVSLDDLESESFSLPADLVNAPGGTVQYLAFLLRGLGISVSIEFTPTARMRFHAVGDAERLTWSRGEVTQPETINYLTLESAKDGLFCERIFGPTKDWECSCGKYKGARFKGTVCDKCGVEITHAKVRRERMGHIELAVPVIHPLYLDQVCRSLSTILNLEESTIRSLIYYEKLGEVGESEVASFLGKDERGALAIQNLINSHVSSEEAMRHRLFLENIIMKTVLVIPPNLHPIVRLDDGRFATSDCNDLYRRVINGNNYLKRMLKLGAPKAIVFGAEKRLQEAVDALFMNSMLDEPKEIADGNRLVSLSDAITQIQFGCNTFLDMLLKRPLDYTAQTRITAEHTGDIDLAFLPKMLADKLFSPFIWRKSRSKSNSDKPIENGAKESNDVTTCDRSKFAILVSIDSSPLRFIALRFQLTHDLTLKVHSGLLDLLGWELLGKSARIFALFSDEAIEEALSTLAPSRLLQQKSPTIVSNSVLDVAKEKIVSSIAEKALLQESVPIGPYEWFLTLPFRYPGTTSSEITRIESHTPSDRLQTQ